VAFIVEMVGGMEGASWHFCCGALVWEQILQLARENGWQPLGTSPDPIWKDVWDRYGNFSANYDCEVCGKIVSAADAATLADALEQPSKRPLPASRKGPLLLSEGMPADACRMVNAALDAAFLPEVIAFLRNGEFSFFWDD
jgi:hypothetical protein